MNTSIIPNAQSPVSKFASFFKLYGIGIGVICAAVPIMTRAVNLLPVYESIKNTLTFSTSLVSFLAIAVLFSVRRHIGQAVFPGPPGLCISDSQNRRRQRNAVIYPILLGSLAIVSLAGYLISIGYSLNSVQGAMYNRQSISTILSETPLVNIPYLAFLCPTYVLMFFGATTVFVWLGLIEYVQMELGIRDGEMITNPYVLMAKEYFKIVDEPSTPSASVSFFFEYNPHIDNPKPILHGPFCIAHNNHLLYEGPSTNGKHIWICQDPAEEKIRHTIILSQDRIDLRKTAEHKAKLLLDTLTVNKARFHDGH